MITKWKLKNNTSTDSQLRSGRSLITICIIWMKEVSFFILKFYRGNRGFGLNSKKVKNAKIVVPAVFWVLNRFGFTSVQMIALGSQLILPPHEWLNMLSNIIHVTRGHKILKNNGFSNISVIAWFGLIFVFALVQIIPVLAKIV